MKFREALHSPVERGDCWETVLHASLMTKSQPVIGMWTHGMTLPQVFMLPGTSEHPFVGEAWNSAL